MTRMQCLTQLYTPLGLLHDGDGDGLPDGLNVRFSVGRTPGAIDVAARLGLESAGYTPGFTRSSSAGVPVYFGPSNAECPAPPFDLAEGEGLVALLDDGGLLVWGWDAARWLAATYPYTGAGEALLADLAPGRPVRSVTIRNGAVVAFTTGEGCVGTLSDKETVTGAPIRPAFTAPAVGDLPPEGPARLFTTAGLLGSSDSVQPDRGGWQVAVDEAVTPAEIAALCELAARTGVEATGLRFPFAVTASSGGVCITLADRAPAAADWAEGHLAWCSGSLTVWGTPEERAAALAQAAATAGLIDGLHATLFTRRAALPEAPRPRGEVLFDLTLEHEWEVDRFRRIWRGVLPELAPGKAVSVDLRLSEPLPVREALAEEMAADLLQHGVPEAQVRVLSAYKQGFHWLEEEMLPRLKELPVARVAVSVARFSPPAADGAEALDLPIRWLQELYPADELLSGALGGLPVGFTLAEAPQAHIYALTALDATGAVLLVEGFSPVCSTRVYLPEFPARGRVHPPTGLLRVEQGGRLLTETAIDTDLEAFWTAYQGEVLPRLRQVVLGQGAPAAPDPAAQPFFGALVVEAALSEDDRRLGIRQEQISPLDALHEDLYFYTLDYLNQLGLDRTGKGYAAPGGVEPWVVAGEGAPQARIRLYALPPAEAEVAPTLPPRAADLPAPAASIPTDVIIAPDRLAPYLAYLAELPGVRVWRTGRSFAGRATWALSVTAPTAGRIAPPQKLSAWRPTFLVNARHHANEVSSTNAVLQLAEYVARQGLANRVNLVVSPLENTDGAALHYAMQQVHPHWKLHAARFNAVGVEFYSEWFAPDPKYGEARTLPTLWRATLPDVVLDDHGYPSHEWVQPFSGYNSPPYFKTSWWMPNALIYSIHRWVDGAQLPANGAVQEGLRNILAERLTADPQVAGYTATLLERYLTYGRQHVPEKFPLEQYKNFIAMTGAAPATPEARTFVGRFPHITAAELVTEVPDETAQGDYLALCVHAHLQADLAVLHYLAERPQPVVRRRWTEDGATCWTAGRERPFRP